MTAMSGARPPAEAIASFVSYGAPQPRTVWETFAAPSVAMYSSSSSPIVTPSGPDSRCQNEISSAGAEALPQPARAASPPAAPRPPAPRRRVRRSRRRRIAVEKVLLCFMCPPLRGGTEGHIGGDRRPAFPWAAVRTLIYSVVNLSVKPAPRRGAYGAGHIGGRGASERTGPSPGASGVLPGPSPPASGLRRAPAVGALSAPSRSATLRRGQPF